jgi:hypothetical protein
MIPALLFLQLQLTPAVEVSPRVMLTLDSIAALAAWEGLEPGACVTSWERKRDTIVVKEVVPGNVARRTPMSVIWDGTMCGDSLPAIHGHLLGLGAWSRPTPNDWIVSSLPYRRAPFMLLLTINEQGVAYQLIAYYVKQ